MPGCNVQREVVGSTARYAIAGKFEGACAWDLAGRIENETLTELILDFSQCREFIDYGVAVLAGTLLAIPGKRVHFMALRQHQLRLFKYFGVDAEELLQRSEPGAPPAFDAARIESEIA
jgi:hypothetical protein